MADVQKTPPAGILSGRAIVTIIGADRVGIIAGIAAVIAEANVNILDISQSVIRAIRRLQAARRFTGTLSMPRKA